MQKIISWGFQLIYKNFQVMLIIHMRNKDPESPHSLQV
jgi:hypothetical protein